MVELIKRMILGLAFFLAGPATPLSRAVEDSAPEPGKPKNDGAGEGKAGRVVSFGMPGEDPPSLFVPLHPQTVEQRRQIEAVTDFSAARAFEHENLWSDAIELLEKALALEPDSAAILKRLSS